MQMYDDLIQLFKIVESTLAFRLDDVALIWICNVKGILSPSNTRKSIPSLNKRIFLKYTIVIEIRLKPTFSNSSAAKDGEEKTFVKLLAVYLMTTIIFLNTSLNAPTWVAHYVDDLASLGCHAWAHATHRWLMSDIPATTASVQLWCKGKSRNSGYLKDAPWP